MSSFGSKMGLFAAGLIAAAVLPAHAGIVISEVDPAGSASGTGYSQDWFELTNTGTSAVDITGWKMDDNSDSFALSVPLAGVTSIAAGQSVVFIESTAGNPTPQSAFETAWFGSKAGRRK